MGNLFDVCAVNHRKDTEGGWLFLLLLENDEVKRDVAHAKDVCDDM